MAGAVRTRACLVQSPGGLSMLQVRCARPGLSFAKPCQDWLKREQTKFFFFRDGGSGAIHRCSWGIRSRMSIQGQSQLRRSRLPAFCWACRVTSGGPPGMFRREMQRLTRDQASCRGCRRPRSRGLRRKFRYGRPAECGCTQDKESPAVSCNWVPRSQSTDSRILVLSCPWSALSI